jgi:hypothetical protein
MKVITQINGVAREVHKCRGKLLKNGPLARCAKGRSHYSPNIYLFNSKAKSANKAATKGSMERSLGHTRASSTYERIPHLCSGPMGLCGFSFGALLPICIFPVKGFVCVCVCVFNG